MALDNNEQSSQTYDTITGSLTSTSNANNTPLNNNNQNNTGLPSYVISGIRPIGATPGFYLKFSDPLTQQQLSEKQTNAIAQDIIKLDIIKSGRSGQHDKIALGIVFNEIRFKIIFNDDPAENMIQILKILKELCWKHYNSTESFILEGGKRLVQHHLNLPPKEAEQFADDILRWGILINFNAPKTTATTSMITTNAAKKGFFDKFMDQASDFFDSNFKKS